MDSLSTRIVRFLRIAHGTGKGESLKAIMEHLFEKAASDNMATTEKMLNDLRKQHTVSYSPVTRTWHLNMQYGV